MRPTGTHLGAIILNVHTLNYQDLRSSLRSPSSYSENIDSCWYVNSVNKSFAPSVCAKLYMSCNEDHSSQTWPLLSRVYRRVGVIDGTNDSSLVVVSPKIDTELMQEAFAEHLLTVGL